MKKQYASRDGREACVVSVSGPDPEFPVIACLRFGDGWLPHCFTDTGSFHRGGLPCVSDLIEKSSPLATPHTELHALALAIGLPCDATYEQVLAKAERIGAALREVARAVLNIPTE